MGSSPYYPSDQRGMTPYSMVRRIITPRFLLKILTLLQAVQPQFHVLPITAGSVQLLFQQRNILPHTTRGKVGVDLEDSLFLDISAAVVNLVIHGRDHAMISL